MGTGKCGLYKGTYGARLSYKQDKALLRFNSAGSKFVKKISTINSK